MEGKQILLGLVAICVLAGAFLGFKMLSGPAGAARTFVADDEQVDHMIRDQNGQEMIAWIHASNNKMILGMTLQQAEGWAKLRYEDGAKTCYAFGGAVSTYLAVELPQDPAKRKTLIDWQNRWAKQHYQKAYKDEGQQYMLFKLSP